MHGAALKRLPPRRETFACIVAASLLPLSAGLANADQAGSPYKQIVSSPVSRRRHALESSRIWKSSMRARLREEPAESP
jgi:hypothetical protein